MRKDTKSKKAKEPKIASDITQKHPKDFLDRLCGNLSESEEAANHRREKLEEFVYKALAQGMTLQIYTIHNEMTQNRVPAYIFDAGDGLSEALPFDAEDWQITTALELVEKLRLAKEAEANRQALRLAALNKLTPEEREALDLKG